MSNDVSTTQRQKFTPTKRLSIYELHKGVCYLCDRQIKSGERWIIEHKTALALGGTNDLNNLAPVHVACAKAKTENEDIPRIAKAKRSKMAALGITNDNKKKIESRGFPKREKSASAGKLTLPRRSLYEDA